MADNERVQEALAAYLDHLEMGGNEPNISHLTEDERRRAPGTDRRARAHRGGRVRPRPRGGGPAVPRRQPMRASGCSPSCVSSSHRACGSSRTATGSSLRSAGIAIVDRFVVGLSGAECAVWLARHRSGPQRSRGTRTHLPISAECSGCSPICRRWRWSVSDLSCVIVEPEDTAPQIQVPSGSLVSPTLQAGDRAGGPRR